MLSTQCGHTIGLGILSWKSHATLINALSSYQAAGILSLFDERIIYFQDITEEDRDIAARFGLQSFGGPNIGIYEGMKKIASLLNTEYVLYLENDCPLVESLDETRRQLGVAVDLIASARIDLMRMRHRWDFGEGFALEKYCRFFPTSVIGQEFMHPEKLDYASRSVKLVRRMLRPLKAKKFIGRSVYVEESPDKLFPNQIERAFDDVFVVDSCCMNWTNQSIFFRKDFFMETIVPYVDTHPSSRTCNGFQTPENVLNSPWWRKQHFKIGVGKGLFTHKRIDDSWRPTHRHYAG